MNRSRCFAGLVAPVVMALGCAPAGDDVGAQELVDEALLIVESDSGAQRLLDELAQAGCAIPLSAETLQVPNPIDGEVASYSIVLRHRCSEGEGALGVGASFRIEDRVITSGSGFSAASDDATAVYPRNFVGLVLDGSGAVTTQDDYALWAEAVLPYLESARSPRVDEQGAGDSPTLVAGAEPVALSRRTADAGWREPAEVTDANSSVTCRECQAFYGTLLARLTGFCQPAAEICINASCLSLGTSLACPLANQTEPDLLAERIGPDVGGGLNDICNRGRFCSLPALCSTSSTTRYTIVAGYLERRGGYWPLPDLYQIGLNNEPEVICESRRFWCEMDEEGVWQWFDSDGQSLLGHHLCVEVSSSEVQL